MAARGHQSAARDISAVVVQCTRCLTILGHTAAVDAACADAVGGGHRPLRTTRPDALRCADERVTVDSPFEGVRANFEPLLCTGCDANVGLRSAISGDYYYLVPAVASYAIRSPNTSRSPIDCLQGDSSGQSESTAGASPQDPSSDNSQPRIPQHSPPAAFPAVKVEAPILLRSEPRRPAQVTAHSIGDQAVRNYVNNKLRLLATRQEVAHQESLAARDRNLMQYIDDKLECSLSSVRTEHTSEALLRSLVEETVNDELAKVKYAILAINERLDKLMTGLLAENTAQQSARLRFLEGFAPEPRVLKRGRAAVKEREEALKAMPTQPCLAGQGSVDGAANSNAQLGKFDPSASASTIGSLQAAHPKFAFVCTANASNQESSEQTEPANARDQKRPRIRRGAAEKVKSEPDSPMSPPPLSFFSDALAHLENFSNAKLMDSKPKSSRLRTKKA